MLKFQSEYSYAFASLMYSIMADGYLEYQIIVKFLCCHVDYVYFLSTPILMWVAKHSIGIIQITFNAFVYGLTVYSYCYLTLDKPNIIRLCKLTLPEISFSEYLCLPYCYVCAKLFKGNQWIRYNHIPFRYKITNGILSQVSQTMQNTCLKKIWDNFTFLVA